MLQLGKRISMFPVALLFVFSSSPPHLFSQVISPVLSILCQQFLFPSSELSHEGCRARRSAKTWARFSWTRAAWRGWVEVNSRAGVSALPQEGRNGTEALGREAQQQSPAPGWSLHIQMQAPPFLPSWTRAQLSPSLPSFSTPTLAFPPNSNSLGF